MPIDGQPIVAVSVGLERVAAENVLTINMIHHSKAFTENIVHVDMLGMAGVRHPVVAYEDDIHDVSEVSSNQRFMQILGKRVDLCKDTLYYGMRKRKVEFGGYTR